MAEQKLPKLTTRVRFPSPAPPHCRLAVGSPLQLYIALCKLARNTYVAAISAFSQRSFQVLDEALNKAISRAMNDAAQRAILPRFTLGSALSSHYKSPGEVVTAADGESEQILCEHLSAIIPGARLVGEEAAHDDPAHLDNLSSGTCWIIDPLDGTGNFAAGHEPFGILVSLAQDGLPIGGWILDPLTGRFCAAQAGKGATVDFEPYRCAAPRAANTIAAVTRLFLESTQRARIISALAIDYRVQDAPRCAADVYPQVAAAEIDVAIFTRVLPWDHGAGVVFLNEAGGRAARADGSAYRIDDASIGLVASNSPGGWQQAVTVLERAAMPLDQVAIPS